MRTKYFAGLFVFILLSACAGGAKVSVDDSTEKKAPVKNSQLLDEKFDIDKLQEPASPITPKIQNQLESHDVDLSATPESSVSDQEMIGYRVQILQTQDSEDARTVQNDAIVQLDADVYSIFDSPYYKIRVGDFTVRADAEELLQRAIDKGYKSSWIVRTKIKASTSQDSLQEE
ncbi:MAG: SPOR domain-containing protein [Deferribacteres bacterium]|nr:SPOR domain-containing protein [candidate division KSB1 bacterium]MCB9502612.1 SPOR domain-containing protein [Deferribacteres bacterium]